MPGGRNDSSPQRSRGSVWSGSSAVRAAVALFALVAAHGAPGDTRQVLQYQYDAAGHIVTIDTSVNDRPPVVDSLNPASVRIGPPQRITASGSGLANVQISTTRPGLTVSNPSSTPGQVSFDLQAVPDTAIGAAALTFTTSLGGSQASIAVQPPLPRLRLLPSPPVLAPGRSLSLEVGLSSPDIFAHGVTLAVLDTALATVAPASVSIASGATRAATSVTLDGLALGHTALRLTSPGLPDLVVPVFVTAPFVAAPGTHAAHAAPLGVARTPPPPAPRLITRGPFPASLSVVKTPAPPPPGATPVAVGAAALGVVHGSGVSGLAPRALIAGAAATTLRVDGIGLAGVNTLNVVPPDGITVSAVSADPGGGSVSAQVSAASGAVLGLRWVVVANAGGPIPAAAPNADRIQVVSGMPRVDSLTPVVLRRTEAATLTIRGAHLGTTESITVSPAAGIRLGGPPHPTGDGGVTIGIEIAADAPLGPRVVTVTTAAGSSSATASVANTLTVVNGPVTLIKPVAAPRLGVDKLAAPPPPPARGALRSALLGVSLGRVVTGLAPASGVIGTSLTLNVLGRDLQAVDGLQLVPATGVTLGTPAPAADGRSVAVTLDIALDAPRTRRTLRVLAAGVEVAPASPSAASLRITAPQPSIRGLSPNFLIAGAGPSTVRVYGANLTGIQSVRLAPPDGVQVGVASSASGGGSFTVGLTPLAGAPPGPRVLIAQTLAGSTATTPSVANTVTVANSIVRTVTPTVAPELGVLRESTTPAPMVTRLTVAPALGVDIPAPPPPVMHHRFLAAPHLGVAVGAVARNLNPAAVPIGTSATLTIAGERIGAVSAVRIEPPDGVSIDAPPVVAAGGRSLSVPITVAADAPTGLRRVIVDTPSGPLAFGAAHGDRLRIAGTVPLITSIDPIQQVPGAAFILTIRGFNLADAGAVRALPPDGVVLGNALTPNAGGTVLSLTMAVLPGAALVPHVIVVDTPAGSTSSVPAEANTFTVVSTR